MSLLAWAAIILGGGLFTAGASVVGAAFLDLRTERLRRRPLRAPLGLEERELAIDYLPRSGPAQGQPSAIVPTHPEGDPGRAHPSSPAPEA